MRVWITVGYHDYIHLFRCLIQQPVNFAFVFLGEDSAGVPHYLAVSLPELANLVIDMLVEIPGLRVFGDFNICAKTRLSGMAQDFMAYMMTK